MARRIASCGAFVSVSVNLIVFAVLVIVQQDAPLTKLLPEDLVLGIETVDGQLLFAIEMGGQKQDNLMLGLESEF